MKKQELKIWAFELAKIQTAKSGVLTGTEKEIRMKRFDQFIEDQKFSLERENKAEELR